MRPAWDDYFMGIAEVVAGRSTCLRRQVGAVVVKDRRILATGYNGAPTGLAHCDEVGCLRQQLQVPAGMRHELCRGLHAEQNGIIQAAAYGVAIQGATFYITHQPCTVCAKMIVNAGARQVIYRGNYPDQLAMDTLLAAGIEVVRLPVTTTKGV